ncbi:hypothetical protein ACQP2F_18450 [Actinoplanes sp. CA-030573]|uniref:hypothetical protein n=1 Tax=Actinoplanes sp. CA-030573 TaxID=3239898 RepID=UPI003D943637
MACPLCEPDSAKSLPGPAPALLCDRHRRQVAASAAAARLMSEPEPPGAPGTGASDPLAEAMRAAARDRAAESQAEARRARELQERIREAVDAVRPSAARLARALTARDVAPDVRVEVHAREQIQRRFGKPKWNDSVSVAAQGWMIAERFSEWTDPDTWPQRTTRRLEGYVLDRSGELARVHTDHVDGDAGGPYVVTVGFAGDWGGDRSLQGPLADHVLAMHQKEILRGLAELAIEHGLTPDELT